MRLTVLLLIALVAPLIWGYACDYILARLWPRKPPHQDRLVQSAPPGDAATPFDYQI